MSGSGPELDDASLARVAATNDDSWAALRGRFGAWVHCTVARAADRHGPPEGLGSELPLVDAVWSSLRADGGAALRAWRGDSQLSTYLMVLARRFAHRALRSAAPPRSPGLFDDHDRRAPAEDGAAVALGLALERLPPPVPAMLRLRFHDLRLDDLAGILGMSQAAARGTLERLADKLAEQTAPAVDPLHFRVLLDAASPAEEVELALAAERDPDVRRLRTKVERGWREVAAASLLRAADDSAASLDPESLAALVDGSMRGERRTRAEAELASSVYGLDEAAQTALDLKAGDMLRAASALPVRVAVLAASVATFRFGLAESLAKDANARGLEPVEVVVGLRRLAQVGRQLEAALAGHEQTSQVVARSRPSPAEAPLLALEALALTDPRAAWRALDQATATGSLIARLRLLAAAAGQDLERGRELAAEAAHGAAFDPGQEEDAQAVLALPRNTALPNETLVRRLRSLLPMATRYALRL